MNWLRGLLPASLVGPRPIPLKALRRMDAETLLRRSRAMASAVYVGDRTVLCRMLSRYRLYVASDDVGFGVHVMLDGLWEGWLTAFMARRIQPGMRIVDAGANHGYYALLFAHLTGPEGRVAAIEPNPRLASLMRRSLYANGFQTRVTLFEQAAGAEDGAVLHLSVPDHEPKNGHLVGEAAPGTVAVQSARLETLLADWPRVDFMKVDVEGHEEAFLDGAWAIIQRDRPMLVLEFNALRSADPAGLLDRLEAVYGRISVIGRDSRAAPADRTRLLDTRRVDDWMLFLEP
ncbi:MAG: FkbM family methyltransferase [Caulobacteraceae bacterium]|nr:FkbM family methyltransferase [Caulobacteraceae bacterium]